MSTTAREAVRFTPADLDAERRILGIVIKHPEQADVVVERLKPEHFHDAAHRKVYEAILDLYNRRGRISYTQLYANLRRAKTVASPETVLIPLTEAFVSQRELLPSIEAVEEKYGRRQILTAAERIQQMILLEEEESLGAYQARAQQLIFEATRDGLGEDDVKDLVSVLHKCYTRLLEQREGRRPYGLLVRLPAVDAITTGFKNKDLIILAARPSMGKTSLALNFAVNVARRKPPVPVLIFSLEMDDEQIGDRLVISELFRYKQEGREIPAREYQTRLDDDKLQRTLEVFNDLYQLPIRVVDRRGLTVAEIRAKARKVKAEVPDLGLIIIDYLQLIKPPAATNKNWALVVGDIVREIRDLAGELDLPIILLSQLNRGVESREDKRPMLSDLRDSGNIEEFADVVMLLYRDDYYHEDKARAEGTEGVVDVIFAKQRKGPTGKAKLKFIKDYTRFIDEEQRDI